MKMTSQHSKIGALYSRNESGGFPILRGSLRFLLDLRSRRFRLELSCPCSFILCATNAKK